MRCGWSAAAPEAAPPVRLVVLVVALEPHHLGVALEGEDVRGDAIEEPAVVADHDGAAGELEERVLERAQRVDVEVVGRLVEQQQVRALAQQLGEVDAVALAAGERAGLLLLVAALEVEPRDVGARRHRLLAQLDLVAAAGDLVEHRLVRIELAGLIDVAELHGLAEPQRAAVGLLEPGDHLEQRGLAGAVRADDADDAAGRQVEVQAVDQQRVAEALAQVLGLDHDVAEARARRDVDLDLVDLLLLRPR